MGLEEYKINASRLSHAYIVSGSPERRMELAGLIAKAAVCSGSPKPCGVCRDCGKADRNIHPDILFAEKTDEDSVFKVEYVRQIRTDAYTVPNEAARKVYIVKDAEDMTPNAQNALLKVLEEPPEYVVFILLCGNAEAFLETVRSRCVVLDAGGEDVPDEAARELAEQFIAACESEEELCRMTFRLDRLDRIGYAVFLDALEEHAAALMRRGPGEDKMRLYNTVVQAVRSARIYLDAKVGVVHINGLICAALIREMRK